MSLPKTSPPFQAFIDEITEVDGPSDRPIFAFNLQDVRQKVEMWRSHFPRVDPFYAMKCNDTPQLIQFMANEMGLGFDCASVVRTLPQVSGH